MNQYNKHGITYRVTTLDDLVGIAHCCKGIPDSSNIMQHLGINLPKAYKSIEATLKSNKGIGLLAEIFDETIKDKKIVGVVYLGEANLWWSDKKFFTNAIFYVAPEYRKKYGIPKTFLGFMKDFSKSTHMPILLDIVNDEGLNDFMVRYYEINGFKNIGFKVVYNPEE